MAFVLLAVLSSLALHSALPIPLAAVAALVIRGRVTRARERTAEAAQRSAVVEFCAALRGELLAGRQPADALAESVWCRPELRDLATAVCPPNIGRDAAELLSDAAGVPGREGLRAVAACWSAAERHGVALSGAVAGIEDGLRAEEQRRQNLAAELSGVRTTVALLGVLPVFGLALGTALGAHPVHALLTRPVGEACLVAGCLLELVGLRWTDRLISALDLRPEPARKTKAMARLVLPGRRKPLEERRA
jgi:tight adherence protein B